MVGRPPDRWHRGRPELRRRPSRRSTPSCCSSAGGRLRHRAGGRADQPRDVLDPDLERALPGQPRRPVPAVPAGRVRHAGRTGAGRRRTRRPLPVAVPVRPSRRTGPALGALRTAGRRRRSYYGGNAGCAGEPPESADVGGSALPSNETFGVTGLDGTGSAEFDVFTSTRTVARVLADRAVLPGGRADHGHQLRPPRAVDAGQPTSSAVRGHRGVRPGQPGADQRRRAT